MKLKYHKTSTTNTLAIFSLLPTRLFSNINNRKVLQAYFTSIGEKDCQPARLFGPTPLFVEIEYPILKDHLM